GKGNAKKECSEGAHDQISVGLMPRGAHAFRSFPHHLNDDAFRALSVELGVIDLLPWAKVETAVGYRNDDLMMHEQALQMRIAVSLTGSVMAVVLAERRELFEPFVDVGDQSVFGVVDPNPGRDVHCGDQDHSFADAAFAERSFDLRRNIPVLPMTPGFHRQILGVKSHSAIIPPTYVLHIQESPARRRRTRVAEDDESVPDSNG